MHVRSFVRLPLRTHGITRTITHVQIGGNPGRRATPRGRCSYRRTNAGFVRKPRRHPTGAGCRLAVLSRIDHGTTTGQAVAPDVVQVTRPWIDGEIVPLAAM